MARECCCDGCQQRPEDLSEDRVFSPNGNLIPRLCCGCVPRYACVSVECLENDTGTTGDKPTMLVPAWCEEAPGDPIMYGVDFPFLGSTLDLRFRWKRDGNRCYFCLTSEALGLDGSTTGTAGPCNGWEINARRRQRPIYFCDRLHVEENQPAYWDVDSDLCGQDKLRVSIGAAPGLPIINRAHKCRDDEGLIVLDNSPLQRICECCDCFCACACITIYGDRRDAQTFRVCAQIEPETGTLGEDTGTGTLPALGCAKHPGGRVFWETPPIATGTTRGAVIELTQLGNGDRRCALDLIQPPVEPEPGSLFDTKQQVLPEPGTTNCQNAQPIQWDYIVENEDNPGEYDAVFVEFRCAPCNECQTVVGCCNELVPPILTATIESLETGSDCPCPDTTLNLVHDRVFGWVADRSTDNIFCEHGIDLRLNCGAPISGTGSGEIREWQLTVTADPCLPSPAIAYDEGFCSPLFLQFEVEFTGGIGCCGQSQTGGGRFRITITE